MLCIDTHTHPHYATPTHTTTHPAQPTRNTNPHRLLSRRPHLKPTMPAAKNNKQKLKKLRSEVSNLTSAIRRSQNRSFQTMWDSVNVDIRDHLEQVDFDIRRDAIPSDERVPYLESTIPIAYRRLIYNQIVPDYEARQKEHLANDFDIDEAEADDGVHQEGVVLPDYPTLKRLLLAYCLGPNEAKSSLALLKNKASYMKYNESFKRFLVRFNTLISRCDEARSIHNDNPDNATRPLDPLDFSTKLDLLGPMLVPSLRTHYSKMYTRVSNMREMINSLKEKDDRDARDRSLACSPDEDPHAPTHTIATAAISGKPTQQLSRSYSGSSSEMVKYWNPNGSPYFPSHQNFMLGPPAPGMSSMPQPNRYNVPIVHPPGQAPVIPAALAAQWAQFLATNPDKNADPTQANHQPTPESEPVPADSLLQAKSTPDAHLSQLRNKPNEEGLNPYSDLDRAPHWSLGFDPIALAVARAKEDEEAFSPFCLWCKTDKHSCRDCPSCCARCGQAHMYSNCPVRHSDVKCRYGHKGHVDKTCIAHICGLGAPRLPGRRVLRLESTRGRKGDNSSVSFSWETKYSATPNRVSALEHRSDEVSQQISSLKKTQIAEQQIHSELHKRAMSVNRDQMEELSKLKALLSKKTASESKLVDLVNEMSTNQKTYLKMIKDNKRETSQMLNKHKQSIETLKRNRRGRSPNRDRFRRRR